MLGTSIHGISQNLVRLDLDCCIADKELFWPRVVGEEVPFWPRLEEVRLTFKAANPSGQSLLERPGRFRANNNAGSGSENGVDQPPRHYGLYCAPDTKPIEPLMHDLHIAIARAAARMPQLHMLWFAFEEEDSLYHSFEFTTRRSTKWAADTSCYAMALYCGDPPLTPSAELKALWEVVAARLGGSLDVETQHVLCPVDKYPMAAWFDLT